MRDIKFRIYFKDEERFMTKPITLEDLLHEDWIDFENEEGTLSLPLKDFRFFYDKNKNYEIMQYTGLKDKNGKEIYEGDIIKCSFYPDFIFEIKFTELCWYMRKIPTSEHINLSDVLYEDLEVIGNIYDNPELLEEGE